MKVIKIVPRGYCYGVVDAMLIAQSAFLDKTVPRPIYILGMIVHNKHVTDAFNEMGIITIDGLNRLEILEKVSKGTIIFTAHGVSPEVRRKAIDKGLNIIDATCPDVSKTHDLIKAKIREGFHVIYVGKNGHPETEGAVGINKDKIHLIQSKEDIKCLDIDSDRILVTNQTTMSQWDIQDIISNLVNKYPNIEVHKEICPATQIRQEAVANQATEADLTIVVGDPKSNNSNRLKQVSEEISKTKAYRVSDVSEIKLEWLKGINTVAVTAGASTPTPITKEVIQFLEKYDENDESTWGMEKKVPINKILPKLKK